MSLYVAAEHGNTQVMATLLEHGAHVGITVSDRYLAHRPETIKTDHSDGDTLLHAAARAPHERALQMLLELNLPVNAVNAHSMTPLHIAAAQGVATSVSELLLHGVRVDSVSSSSETPLLCAAAFGHTNAVKTLFASGASVDTVRCSGDSALHLAAHRGHSAVVSTLVAHGADVNATNAKGETPLFAAAESHTLRRDRSDQHQRDIMVKLLEHGASVDTVTVSGETPLHSAAAAKWQHFKRERSAVATTVLLAHGANVDAADRKHDTPLHVAATNKFPRVCERYSLQARVKTSRMALVALHVNGRSRTSTWKSCGSSVCGRQNRSYSCAATRRSRTAKQVPQRRARRDARLNTVKVREEAAFE